MAGHNKWSKVKHIKARVDVVKGRVFSRCSHEIALAAKSGGADPSTNARLRTAIDNAKAVSMPKDKIERAVLKGIGELGGDSIQEVTYEGYGPSGIAFLIEMATDNLNRSAADIRSIFTKNHGSVATPGSVAYQFDRKGRILIDPQETSDDELMLLALEAGAEDMLTDEEETAVLTDPTQLNLVAGHLRQAGVSILSESLVSIPQATTVIEDQELASQIIRLHEQIEDYQDTLNVFSNFDVADHIVGTLAH